MLSPRRLADIMADLAAIDHVRIIRMHTRVPVADPARISAQMIAALKAKGATTWVALHANHVRELTDKARAACAEMIDAGIPMVSQSVLLRGVNDNAAALEALMRAFVECRIKPYYLHHGDLAPGTAHLRTTLAHGQELMRALRGRVSGLCQPEYVLDIPGGHGKAPVGPNYLSHANSFSPTNSFSKANSKPNSFSKEREQQAETRYRIIDYCGDVHHYPPKP
jgi:lysine 2,3-aminomutase